MNGANFVDNADDDGCVNYSDTAPLTRARRGILAFRHHHTGCGFDRVSARYERCTTGCCADSDLASSEPAKLADT